MPRYLHTFCVAALDHNGQEDHFTVTVTTETKDNYVSAAYSAMNAVTQNRGASYDNEAYSEMSNYVRRIEEGGGSIVSLTHYTEEVSSSSFF